MIKFLRGKPSLGFGGGSIAIRKAGTKQEEPLTIVALGLGTITQFAMRNKVAFIGTAEGATLYNVDTKVKNTYTLADLGVQSIDELDISAEEDKAIVRSGTTVYLYAVANGAINIASKVTLPYAYCNFTDINNRAIAGNGAYPSASGTTKILKFTTGLTYTVAEVLGGSWNHVGKATPQGYGVTLSNHWHNENINTAYPINSETDNPTCEVLTKLTDMGVSINNTYTLARDGVNYKVYTNVASGAATLTKTVTGVGGTAFRFYSDTVIWALSKYSVKVYDFVNEEVLHTIGFDRTINTNFLAACNEKLYTIDKDNNLCTISAIDQAEIPLPPYTALEYIRGTGNVYIPTGYIAKDNTTFEFKFRSDTVSTAYESLFGSRTMVFERKESRTDAWQFTRGSYDTFSGKYSLIGEDWVQGQAYVVTIKGVDANNTEIYRDGILKLSFDRPLRDGYPLILFSNSDGGRISKMCLYYFKIYEGETLVHNYQPAMFDDGTVTLYDLVTGDILSVSGTGEFAVPPASSSVTPESAT